MKQKKKIIRPGDMIFNTINVVAFGIFTFICIYPFYYILINSISDNLLVAAGQVRILPKGIHFNNYINTFRMNGIASAAVTSVLRTVLGTFAMLLSSTVLGYAMTKREYWHRKFWYRFLVVTMYFGAGLIPGYMNIKRLGLMNSFWVYVLPALVSPYNMILIKTYIESIPESLEEAAIMDGGGYFQRFIRIVVPLSKPIIATVSVFTAVGQWNSFMDTVLYMSQGQYQTLQSVLYGFLNQANKLAELVKSGGAAAALDFAKQFSPVALKYTVTAVTLLPILMVYPFFQRFFTKGIMIGAVKG